MIEPRHLADHLVDDQAVAATARLAAGRLASLHAFQATPAARLYPLEVRRLAQRANAAIAELLEVAAAARAREEAVP